VRSNVLPIANIKRGSFSGFDLDREYITATTLGGVVLSTECYDSLENNSRRAATI
jgi:hypothetical protein